MVHYYILERTRLSDTHTRIDVLGRDGAITTSGDVPHRLAHHWQGELLLSWGRRARSLSGHLTVSWWSHQLPRVIVLELPDDIEPELPGVPRPPASPEVIASFATNG